MHTAQIKAYQSMTPEQKLQITLRLYYSAKELKAAWLRQLHTEWSDEKIEHAVRESFANARS